MSASTAMASCLYAKSHTRFSTRNGVLDRSCRFSSSSSEPSSSFGARFSLRFSSGSFSSTVSKRFKTRMEWQECKGKMKVDVPASVAYKLYSDRESIPRWMSFISSVEVWISIESNQSLAANKCGDHNSKGKILKDKPDLSRWSLKYQAFGHDIEYSWLARNLQPIPNQKIHWRSLEGLPNRGIVRFFPRGPSSCIVELTFSYEVPPLLVPVASALQPLMEGMIKHSLEKFADIVKNS